MKNERSFDKAANTEQMNDAGAITETFSEHEDEDVKELFQMLLLMDCGQCSY